MRGSDGKPLAPPGYLVLQHKEPIKRGTLQRIPDALFFLDKNDFTAIIMHFISVFQNSKTANFQLSYDLRNVYYHARFECVRRNIQQLIAASIFASAWIDSIV